eukprot:1321299-Pyramimonas_sp.AAC.1
MKAERRLARSGIPLVKEVPKTPIAFLFPGQGSQVYNTTSVTVIQHEIHRRYTTRPISQVYNAPSIAGIQHDISIAGIQNTTSITRVAKSRHAPATDPPYGVTIVSRISD